MLLSHTGRFSLTYNFPALRSFTHRFYLKTLSGPGRGPGNDRGYRQCGPWTILSPDKDGYVILVCTMSVDGGHYPMRCCQFFGPPLLQRHL